MVRRNWTYHKCSSLSKLIYLDFTMQRMKKRGQKRDEGICSTDFHLIYLLTRNFARIWNKSCMAPTFTSNLKNPSFFFNSMIGGYDTQSSPSLAISSTSKSLQLAGCSSIFIVRYVLKSRCKYQRNLDQLSDVTIKLYKIKSYSSL